MTFNLPEDAKPHECAVLICYSLGIRSPDGIANTLHYPTKDTVYKVLNKYRDKLPSFVSHSQRMFGKGFLLSP